MDKKASELLEESAGPFDAACMLVRDMEERMAMIYSLLNSGFDPDGPSYDLQAVNQAHRIAGGGEMPRKTGVVKYFTPDDAGSGQMGICIKCLKSPTIEGHDGCLGTLPGPVMNACCGHGEDRMAYIQYWGGRRIAGSEAIKEQQRLIKIRSEQEHLWQPVA